MACSSLFRPYVELRPIKQSINQSINQLNQLKNLLMCHIYLAYKLIGDIKKAKKEKNEYNKKYYS